MAPGRRESKARLAVPSNDDLTMGKPGNKHCLGEGVDTQECDAALVDLPDESKRAKTRQKNR